MKQQSVMLGLPTYKYVPVETLGSHVTFAIENTANKLLGGFVQTKDVFIDQARNEICVEAIKAYEQQRITHVIMIDDDMVVPHNALSTLLECHRPVTSALYFHRDGSPVAFTLEPYKSIELGPVFSTTLDASPTPLAKTMQVEGVGMGCCLIDCQVLVDMADAFDDAYWFKSGPEPADLNAGKAFLGEDAWFCYRLKKMGLSPTLCLDVVCEHMKTSAVQHG